MVQGLTPGSLASWMVVGYADRAWFMIKIANMDVDHVPPHLQLHVQSGGRCWLERRTYDTCNSDSVLFDAS